MSEQGTQSLMESRHRPLSEKKQTTKKKEFSREKGFAGQIGSIAPVMVVRAGLTRPNSVQYIFLFVEIIRRFIT